jgi:DNA-directed RNA polymerase specialized sigma24 family protein
MEVVFNKIEKTIKNMYWYDKKMLNLYVYHIPSIRRISTATTISSKAVFKTLKRAKLTIKKEIAKEYYYGKTA